MPRFLFWNLNNKPLAETLARLAFAHDIDVLMLAECDLNPGGVLNALNDGSSGSGSSGVYYHAPCRLCTRIKIFLRFSDEYLPIAAEGDRLTIRRLTLPDKPEILLAVVHVISKVRYSPRSQEEEARDLAQSIRAAEHNAGHSRTLLVGDLNMNPFEYGVAGAGTLNAMMTRGLASKQSRIVLGKAYPYFYNPMWGHFGDSSGSPAGTHYYRKSDHLCYFWNMFDQVLLRPALFDNWQPSSLKILQSDGERSFIDNDGGRPRDMSDHLPILFDLTL